MSLCVISIISEEEVDFYLGLCYGLTSLA